MATEEQLSARGYGQKQQGSVGGWLFSGYADIDEGIKKRPCSRGGNQEAMSNKNKHQGSLHLFGGESPEPQQTAQILKVESPRADPPSPRVAQEHQAPEQTVASPRGPMHGRRNVSNMNGAPPAPHQITHVKGGSAARSYAQRNWGSDVISHNPCASAPSAPEPEPEPEPQVEEARNESVMSEASTALPATPEPAVAEPATPEPTVAEPASEPVAAQPAEPAQEPAAEPVADPPAEPMENLKIDLSEKDNVDSKPEPETQRSGRRHVGGNRSSGMAGILGGGDSPFATDRDSIAQQPSPRQRQQMQQEAREREAALYNATPRRDNERSRNAQANRGTLGSILYGGGN